MTDKSNSAESSPNDDDTKLSSTWVSGESDEADQADVDTSATVLPASQENAEPPDSDDSDIAIDVSATFIPNKQTEDDDGPQSDKTFDADVTFIGESTGADEADSPREKTANAGRAVHADATYVPAGDDAVVNEPDDDFTESAAADQEGAASGSGKSSSADGSSSGTKFDEQSSGMDATIVGESGNPQANANRNLTSADPLTPQKTRPTGGSRSGSGSSQSGAGSRVTSQIWKTNDHSDLDQLISMRIRPVSGMGQTEAAEYSDFEVIEKLAEGGMGIVYVARQKSLNRQLAIKTLKGAGTLISGTVGRSKSARAMSRSDRQKREMFLSEALVTANLVHPNIIPIHELAETEDGMPYYVMKQVHGTPWNKLIKEMSLEENLSVLHKACDAIAFAHHHGVINRDLKPENIMLGEFGEVLVLDWGLAVPAPHAAEKNFRSPVASFGAGTPAYMSPELWAGPPEAIGECSDIYLLGAILFEVVTGEPPHEFPRVQGKDRSDLWKTIDKVLRENRIRSTEITGELIDVALKAMRTDPDDRYGSVQEFQFCVRNYQRHEESRRLSARAIELVQTKTFKPRDYHTYQTASALFEEALRTWQQNPVARTELRTTRLHYAQLAESRGDYALGLQVASQESDDEFVMLSKRLSRARQIRSGAKWAAVTAMLCVVALGAKSIYDNGIITNLGKEVAVRQAEAIEAIAAADSANEEADIAQEKADSARQASAIAQAAADKSKAEAITASEAATEATELAAIAKANADLAIAEQKKAETAARVAQVEIQSQSIRGLTLNQNYSDALREINELLSGELLPELPEDIRNTRTAELEAQRGQLLKRTRQSRDPIQAQAVSPNGAMIAFGDSAGTVTLMQNPGPSLFWDKGQPRDQKFDHEITALRFIDDERLAIASGSELFLWNLAAELPEPLEGHEHAIQAFDANNDFLLSADESGKIVIRDQQTGLQVSELRLRTQLRDVAFIPGTNDFICAGSRGGESTDILAYRLLNAKPTARPERRGQLRMNRQQNDPPRRISISPDGLLLVISNSDNGNLIVLKSEVPLEGDENQFPYEHPADLESKGDTTWLVEEHERPVNDIQWSQNGMKCLTASDDRTIGVWSRLQSGDAILVLDKRLRGHGARVTRANFLDVTANRVVSSSADELNRLWNLETLDEDERQIKDAFHLTQISQRPTRSRIAAAGISRSYLLTAFRPDTDSATDEPRPELNDSTEKRIVRRAVRTAASPWLRRPSQRENESGGFTIPLGSGSECEGRVVNSADVWNCGGHIACLLENKQVDSKDGNEKDGDEDVTLNAGRSVQRGSVRAICFTRNDQLVVAGAADGSIEIWDAKESRPVAGPITATGGVVERFHEGHDFNIARMSIIGDSGTLLATSGFDGSLRIWNMDQSSLRLGVQRQVIVGLGLVNTFAASPNGEFLVTSAVQNAESPEPGHCSCWNLKALLSSTDAKPFAALAGAHQAEVTAISVSPDNQQIATGGRDGLIAVWDAVTGELITSQRAHTKNTIITSLYWMPDGTLMSAGLDGQLPRWSVETFSGGSGIVNRLTRRSAIPRGKTPIESMLVSPNGQQILTLSVETDRVRKRTLSHIDVWSVGESESRHRVQLATVAGNRPDSITSADWSPDGRQLLVCVNGVIQIVDTESWEIVRVFKAGPGKCSDAKFAEQLSPTGEAKLIVTFDGTTASLWNLESNAQLANFRGPFPVSAVGVLSDGDQDFVVAGGISLRVFGGQVGAETFGRPLFRTREGLASQITSLSVCPTDLSMFAAASSNGAVSLWRWHSAKLYAEQVRILNPPGHHVSCCGWSRDGASVLAVGLEGILAICSADGTSRREIKLDSEYPVSLYTGEFSPDGQHIVAVGEVVDTGQSMGWVVRVPAMEITDGTAAITDPNLPPDEPADLIACRFSGHQAGGISSVGFVPDSPYLVSGGNDGALVLWNWKQSLPGTPPMAYEAFRFMASDKTTAHRAPITSLAVAKSGRIASASTDGEISLWNVPISYDRD